MLESEKILIMKHIEKIIDDHINFYGLKSQINITAAKTFFDLKLYDDCVIEVLRQYNIHAKLRIVKTANIKSSAEIETPVPMPMIGSKDFKEYRFVLRYNDSKLHNLFEYFLFIIAHEIGHLLLNGTYNSHRKNEQAVDLIALVMGFDQMLYKTVKIYEFHGQYNFNTYLSKEEIMHAYNYIQIKRKLLQGKKQKEKKSSRVLSWIKGIFNKLRNTT